MLNKALLCLGSNVPSAVEYLAAAVVFLQENGAIVRTTQPYLTDPEYQGDVGVYQNQLIELAVDCDYDTLKTTIKAYEAEIRAAGPAKPFVNIDLDIVIWNEEVVRPKDAAADYFKSGLKILANPLPPARV